MSELERVVEEMRVAIDVRDAKLNEWANAIEAEIAKHDAVESQNISLKKELARLVEYDRAKHDAELRQFGAYTLSVRDAGRGVELPQGDVDAWRDSQRVGEHDDSK